MADRIYKLLGSNGEEERERNDYYVTDPIAIELLLDKIDFSHKVWECAVGGGHLAEVLKKRGHDVACSDIIDRGYHNTEIINFINPSIEQIERWKELFIDTDIITNPPYSHLEDFLRVGLSNLQEGHKLALFVRIQALESQRRRKIYDRYPIWRVYVPSKRIVCRRNNEEFASGGAMLFCWLVFVKGYTGDTTVHWLD